MSQPTSLKPKPRPSLDWPRPRRALPRLMSRQAALLGVLMLLCLCYVGPLHPESTAVLAVKRELPVYCVERDDEVITVSFDASWGGDQTRGILDLLDQYDAKATFFLVGIWVDKFPELVKEIHDRGHEIGNHSDSHPQMSKLSDAEIRRELDGCSDKIEAITGVRPTLFRPPYGDYDNAVVTVARSEGYEVVQWSVDSLDWKNRGAEDLIRRATSKISRGDIVLFHNDSKYILDALPSVLSAYRDKGLRMIPAGEILLQGPTTIDVQGRQHPVPD